MIRCNSSTSALLNFLWEQKAATNPGSEPWKDSSTNMALCFAWKSSWEILEVTIPFSFWKPRNNSAHNRQKSPLLQRTFVSWRLVALHVWSDISHFWADNNHARDTFKFADSSDNQQHQPTRYSSFPIHPYNNFIHFTFFHKVTPLVWRFSFLYKWGDKIVARFDNWIKGMPRMIPHKRASSLGRHDGSHIWLLER